VASFKEKVIHVVRMIPYGCVASYGQVALYCGLPRAAREVGWTLKNTSEDVPWWRVVNNAGRISIEGNWEVGKEDQARLLRAEGVELREDFSFDIEKYRWRIHEDEVRRLQLPQEIVRKIVEKYSL
jgi:methylated-DNA-protein-cysteine methyltransferase related protein